RPPRLGCGRSKTALPRAPDQRRNRPEGKEAEAVDGHEAEHDETKPAAEPQREEPRREPQRQAAHDGREERTAARGAARSCGAEDIEAAAAGTPASVDRREPEDGTFDKAEEQHGDQPEDEYDEPPQQALTAALASMVDAAGDGHPVPFV